MTYAKNDVAIHAFFFLARDFFFTKITTTTTFDSTNILFNELYYNSISGVSYSPCISRAPRCRFVKVIAHGRRDQRVEADRPSLPRITLTSIAQDFDQSPRRVHSRDIPRNRNVEILRDDVTLSRRKPSLHRIRNSNDTRAPFFFFFLSRLRPRRRCSCTRIVIRRPGRNDSANGTTLAVVSTR